MGGHIGRCGARSYPGRSYRAIQSFFYSHAYAYISGPGADSHAATGGDTCLCAHVYVYACAYAHAYFYACAHVYAQAVAHSDACTVFDAVSHEDASTHTRTDCLSLVFGTWLAGASE